MGRIQLSKDFIFLYNFYKYIKFQQKLGGLLQHHFLVSFQRIRLSGTLGYDFHKIILSICLSVCLSWYCLRDISGHKSRTKMSKLWFSKYEKMVRIWAQSNLPFGGYECYKLLRINFPSSSRPLEGSSSFQKNCRFNDRDGKYAKVLYEIRFSTGELEFKKRVSYFSSFATFLISRICPVHDNVQVEYTCLVTFKIKRKCFVYYN